MGVSREEFIASNKAMHEKINKIVKDVFFDEYIPSIRGVIPIIHKHPDGSITFVTEDFIEFAVNNWPCALFDKRTSTFYYVARMFCSDSSKYPELDKAFSEFFNREKLQITNGVFIYDPVES